ncbi:hypothetical protein HDU76_012961, partial [Blyttiomyces sp. JEL0837]
MEPSTSSSAEAALPQDNASPLEASIATSNPFNSPEDETHESIATTAAPEVVDEPIGHAPSVDIQSMPPPSLAPLVDKQLPAAPTQSDAPVSYANGVAGSSPPIPERSQSEDGPAKEYTLKPIEWKDPRKGPNEPVKQLKIISQNKNGPCPLLAL